MSDALLEAFKTAATTPGKDENGKDLYIAAVLQLIEDNADTLLQDGYATKFSELPAGQGRQQAIAKGLKEQLDLFGDFQSVDELKSAVGNQVEIEHAKFSFINAVDTASDIGTMTTALKDWIGTLVEHRQFIIVAWSIFEGNAAVAERVEQLKADSYTVVLNEIAVRLSNNEFVSDFAAKLLEARDAMESDKFFGVYAIIDAMNSAANAIDAELVAQFNEADTWEEALAAIKENVSTLLDGDHLAKLNALPDNQGREKAIGLGILEIKSLFGNYADVADVKTAIERQIEVEHAKFEFITALDAATTAEGMADALEATVELVNQHRQQLITAWSQSDLPAVVARAKELADSAFTKVLAEIVKHLDDDTYMGKVGDLLLTARGSLPDGQFYGDGKIIPALDSAMDSIDPVYAFNSATTTAETLTAITAHVADLLDSASELEYSEIPNGSGRQKAVADGMLEIKKFFGDFTAETLAEARDHQVSVEHTKYVFIQAVDNPTNADAIAKALVDYVGKLNEQRQELIDEWEAITGNAALAARVAELKAETYTIALKTVADRLGDTDFVDELAASLLEAREDNGGRFNGIVTITNAMAEVVGDINVAPTAPGTNTITINEDTPSSAMDIGASDLDGDDLTYTVKANAKPQKGTVIFDQDHGTFTYKPADNVNGTDTFTIVISDGNGGTAEQVVTVTIKPVNDTPWDISLSNAQIVENSKAGTEVGKLTGSDYDGDALTFTLLDDAGGRFIIDATGSLKVANDYALDFEQAASHTVKVQVKDSAGTAYEESFSIGVTDVANEKVTGTASADVLKGGSGKDTFKGGSGNDKLYGGIGNDTLTGDKGKDIFVFDSKLGTSSTDRKVNFDKIKDFSVKDDSIWLDNAVFTKLGKKGTEAKPAQLSKSFFTIGDKAHDKNDYLIYNNKTGVLSYDADGSGKGKAIEFAQLSKKLALTNKDFFVI